MDFKESIFYDSNDEYNRAFIKATEKHLNEQIKVQGYLYENQIFEALGLRWDPSQENRLYLSNDKINTMQFVNL